jgi:hypothetical protein
MHYIDSITKVNLIINILSKCKIPIKEHVDNTTLQRLNDLVMNEEFDFNIKSFKLLVKNDEVKITDMLKMHHSLNAENGMHVTSLRDNYEEEDNQ